MKLATYKDGTRDGQLVVVAKDLSQAHYASGIASRLQQVLDDWNFLAPQLQDLYDTLNQGKARHAFPFDPRMCMAPLPRAYQWADGSAYINHVELVRASRHAKVPDSYYTDPLMYQGGSDDFLGPTDDVVCVSEDHGIDFEAELAVITGDVPMGTDADAALDGIRLLMLANDVSLRHLIPDELAKGFGFFQSKPATAFGPVAVTPDELGGLATWPGASDGAVDLERAQSGHVRSGARDDLSLRPTDRPHLQNPQRACGLHRGQWHHQQQGHRQRRPKRVAQGLQLHRRKASHRNHPGRSTQHRVHEIQRHHSHRNQGARRAKRVWRHRPKNRSPGLTCGSSFRRRQIRS